MEDVANTIRIRLEHARQAYGFRIVQKSKSPFMWALFYVGLMPLWQPGFMTTYTTTIGATMWTPLPPEQFGENGVADLALLNHELKHIEDSRTILGPPWLSSIVYVVGYLFPQVLAPLSFLGLVWWPFWLFGLALLPWPAPFRVWVEVRGYEATLSTHLEEGEDEQSLRDRYRPFLLNQFTGWPYYRMALPWAWPNIWKKFELIFWEKAARRGRS